jgi:hypothetical protein
MKHAYRPLPVEVYKLKSRSFYGEIRDRLEIEYFLFTRRRRASELLTASVTPPRHVWES